MKILITGCLGFAGKTLCESIMASTDTIEIIGMDNFSRNGCELNLEPLRKLGIGIIRGDIRIPSDLMDLPAVDWVVDCAANPSVLAGIGNETSSRQVMEHNLVGTINLLEYCKQKGSGIILLSTSRVYSAEKLARLPIIQEDNRYSIKDSFRSNGISSKGISEDFPTSTPLSLYGASKLASETIILEYANCFGFPAWINRCGVLAGAGQFGKADQGIFSFWIHSFLGKCPLEFIGFEGSGLQVRDALHPKDLAPLLLRQMDQPNREAPKIVNLGGGRENSMSLKQLSSWCEDLFGPNEVTPSNDERPMDAPWIVMDSSLANEAWDWSPKTKIQEILEEIATHAEENPRWLKISS
ncbi:NAD-dependent epimerase/dehydratase family protein [Verrucomicrobia bacterium]|nr:NAD-dependent epimerase/dehydratase family protein [Verrucomicrobiota bacterium]